MLHESIIIPDIFSILRYTSSESAASEPANKTPQLAATSKSTLQSVLDEMLEVSTVAPGPESATASACIEVPTYLSKPTIKPSDNHLLY